MNDAQNREFLKSTMENETLSDELFYKKNKWRKFFINSRALKFNCISLLIILIILGIYCIFFKNTKVDSTPIRIKIDELNLEEFIFTNENIIDYLITNKENNFTIIDDLTDFSRVIKVEDRESSTCFLSQAFGVPELIDQYTNLTIYNDMNSRNKTLMIFVAFMKDIVERDFLNERSKHICKALPLFLLRQVTPERKRRDSEEREVSLGINLGFFEMKWSYMKTYEMVQNRTINTFVDFYKSMFGGYFSGSNFFYANNLILMAISSFASIFLNNIFE